MWQLKCVFVYVPHIHKHTLELFVTTSKPIADQLPPTGEHRVPVSGMGLLWLQHNVAITPVPGIETHAMKKGCDPGRGLEEHKSSHLQLLQQK